jgi:antitoxin VapB
VTDMQTAKLFMKGRSQAVRLPMECRLAGKEVYVRKLGGIVILIPKDDPRSSFARSLEQITEGFLAERKQPPAQRRKRSR